MWARRVLDIATAVVAAIAVTYALIGHTNVPPLMVLEFAIPIIIVYVAARWNRKPRA